MLVKVNTDRSMMLSGSVSCLLSPRYGERCAGIRDRTGKGRRFLRLAPTKG
jgi:hypothetical protein